MMPSPSQVIINKHDNYKFISCIATSPYYSATLGFWAQPSTWTAGKSNTEIARLMGTSPASW